MFSNTQYRVACELGYCDRIVKRILQRRHFKDAGSLVEYLDDNEEELMNEESNAPPSPIPPKREKPKLSLFIPPINALTLREETEKLYRQSSCALCRKERRTHVLLPCGHYAVCGKCVPTIKHCPIKACNQLILSKIQTY